MDQGASLQVASTSAATCTAAQMRVRKEVRDLTTTEWRRYVLGVQSLRNRKATLPQYAGLTLFEQYAAMHRDHAELKHSDPRFFPWHNVYLRALENDLRMYDSRISLPYWSWDLDSNAPEMSPVMSASYYGSSNPWNCVPNGPFRFVSHVDGDPGFNQSHCVTRGYSPDSHTTRLTSTAEIALLMKTAPSFSSFSFSLEFGGHGAVHNWVQGDMATMYSPNDALFFAHHTLIDKVWRDFQTNRSVPYEGAVYQQQGLITRNATSADPLFPFAHAGSGQQYTVGDVYSNSNLCEFYIPPKQPAKTSAVVKRDTASASGPPRLDDVTEPDPARCAVPISYEWATMMRLSPSSYANVLRNNLATENRVHALARAGQLGSLKYPHAWVPPNVMYRAQHPDDKYY
ncbi:hypothetical protein RI367_006799 [Sorochytrium milnesiophthora]